MSESSTDDLIQDTVAHLHKILKQKGWTVATAESLTAGLLASSIAAQEGASQILLGGAITYCNAEKVRQCGVYQTSLNEFSAVSDPIARQMAEGIRKATGATLGLSTTGYAGPGPGERGEPAGTFYVGVAFDGNVIARRHKGAGGRNEVRKLAVLAALVEALAQIEITQSKTS